MNAILCLGDSITFGRGEVPALGWCGRLKTWWESKDKYNAVYNLGIPGDTSRGLLGRIKTEISNRVRHLREDDEFRIIVAIGTNDLCTSNKAHSVPVDEFEQNMTKIISTIQKYVKTFYVLEIPPVHSVLAQNFEGQSLLNTDVVIYNRVLHKIAGEHFVHLDLKNWDEKLPDGIHPNSLGYDEIFEKVKLLF